MQRPNCDAIWRRDHVHHPFICRRPCEHWAHRGLPDLVLSSLRFLLLVTLPSPPFFLSQKSPRVMDAACQPLLQDYQLESVVLILSMWWLEGTICPISFVKEVLVRSIPVMVATGSSLIPCLLFHRSRELRHSALCSSVSLGAAKARDIQYKDDKFLGIHFWMV